MSTTRTHGRGWAYAGALLGGAVSIAANVAHSYVPPVGTADTGHWQPQSGAVIGAVFWPLSLFVAVEILARTAWPSGRRWVAARYLGLLPVALVAAVVSYRHLSGLLAFYHEDALTGTIGPLAVDGLMVMATGALIATGARRLTPVPVADEAPELPADPEPAEPEPERADEPADIVPDISPDTPRTPKRTPRRTGKTATATAARRLRDRHPDMSTADIARRLGVTDRTIRRHLATEPASGQPDRPLIAA